MPSAILSLRVTRSGIICGLAFSAMRSPAAAPVKWQRQSGPASGRARTMVPNELSAAGEARLRQRRIGDFRLALAADRAQRVDKARAEHRVRAFWAKVFRRAHQDRAHGVR